MILTEIFKEQMETQIYNSPILDDLTLKEIQVVDDKDYAEITVKLITDFTENAVSLLNMQSIRDEIGYMTRFDEECLLDSDVTAEFINGHIVFSIYLYYEF